ncbi:MAG TPA: ACT domain-containing protein [Rhizobiaceae bacterium]|nr:ACT domain-containing protein [Rhizobiaceae bacterium]
MTGEKDLAKLLGGMRPRLQDQIYVFASIPSGEDLPSSIQPIMVFREAEGLTAILPASEAREVGIDCAFRCRMITLEIHSSLEAVGFLAAITARLAEAGIGVNPVSAFHHDHLFVPADKADEAVAVLRELVAADRREA